ncbi:cytochrome P450 [Cecembia sp.]|jgi:cytochrome P450|uniref:cytochrome P450 n=1 Tax=Cecembia sp. TaxID=1898110 RepID=UPI0025C2C42B|nr:cytochrome P450 [Cecembia sp.]
METITEQKFQFNPYSPIMDADPFPFYKTLRDQYPCFWSDDVNMWILSRYDDIKRAGVEWETFSSSEGNLVDELPGRSGSTLGTTDPPRHDRLRKLIQSAFAKNNLMHLMDPTKELVTEVLDKVLEMGSFDFVQDFSSQITVGTLFAMMGLPDEDHHEVRRNVILSIQSDQETRQKGPEHIGGFKFLTNYVEDIVRQRRADPKDDLISRLILAEIDGDKLEEAEIIMTSATIILAGVESLSSFLSMMAYNMATFPDARRRIAADASLMPKAIEETLRFNTSAQRFKRVLTKDLEMHGQQMKKGDFVMLCYGSANRDERFFRNPDVYDLERNTRGHLGFGGGVHLCLGNMFARMITTIAMGEFFTRIPEYYISTEQLDWNPSTTFRSPVKLPLTIGK